MKILSQICSFLAIWLLRNEWQKLQNMLIKFYPMYNESCYDVPILAQQLLISGEDHRFFQHGGIDPIAICRAIWRRLIFGKHEGASTIEMQIVRVVSGRFEPTLKRKIKEMGLATLLTRLIPKDQLPALYLQIGYYGWRMNGFENACRRLGLNKNSITSTEATQLVARLKYPQPRRSIRSRRDQIITRGEHLLYLYRRHKLNKTYLGLNNLVTNYETV